MLLRVERKFSRCSRFRIFPNAYRESQLDNAIPKLDRKRLCR